MATLSEVRKEHQDKLTSVMNNHGAFFCFSEKQFQEKRNPDIQRDDYRALFAGMVAPKDNCSALIADMNELRKETQAKELASGRYELIRYELSNHECFYTGSVEDVVDMFEDYGITRAEINAAYVSKKAWQKFMSAKKKEGDKV